MTHDEERLERYLEWRRAEHRDRAARRRRVVGYVAAPILCVIAVGVAAWIGRMSSQPSTTATVDAPSPPAAPPTESAPVGEPADTPAPPPRVEPPARARVRSRPTPSNGTLPRPSVVARPTAPAERQADSPDFSASVAPAPASPPPTMQAPAESSREALAAPPETPAEAPRAVETAPAPEVATPPATEVATAPATEVAAPSAPGAPAPATAPSGGAVAVAPPTVRDRVTGWAKGEVEEFRDGVKREVNQFRSGYEKVRDFFKR